MQKELTLESKVSKRISRKKANVFLRDDFKDLGEYDQVGRVLRKLATKGKVVRIGYGLYAKTKVSTLTGEMVPISTLPNLGKEAMKRLKVKIAPTTADVAYQEGRSMQVPTGRLIGVKSRVSRKIGYKGAYIRYEHVH
ncbi:DUF6088 family protein [Spirosoma utsteinense]|uniref:S-adenosylhomocysteine hydrolase n=1 Tax=Spirosoma utsteinense TaxID=2585773 RepID=A0ABR6WF55_9BACT|nr:DUF6088 family protein [Spirosoma utsteinense]MBC3789247.1 hypothetical protein [Spirosoma utsteinense]MBC3795183.1 hypothetical protein [Spirosoma utsteinense]